MTPAEDRLNMRLRGEAYLLEEPSYGFPTEEDKIRFVAKSRERMAMFRQDLEIFQAGTMRAIDTNPGQ